MTTNERSIYGRVKFGNIMPIVSVLETEICDMLSEPEPDMEEIGKTLRERNLLIARYERMEAELTGWVEDRLAERERGEVRKVTSEPSGRHREKVGESKESPGGETPEDIVAEARQSAGLAIEYAERAKASLAGLAIECAEQAKASLAALRRDAHP